jgi:serine/threonine protein kinase
LSVRPYDEIQVAESSTPNAPPIGETLLRKYRLDELVGEGGMGWVFKATHLHLGKRVAVKMMTPASLEQKSLVDRFFREARAVALVKSPHVCEVYDVDRTKAGLPFIVMEWLDGKALDAKAKENPSIPAGEKVWWAVEACFGLAAVHAAGLIHRDIKPANLMLVKTSEGARVKLVDFGVVRSMESNEMDLTGDAAIGTLKYMSPEQLVDSRGVDAKADIWALGVTLYRLLTGRLPFSPTSTSEYMRAVMHSMPEPLYPNAPGISEELSKVVMWALERAPEHRPKTALAWAEALAAFAEPPSDAAATTLIPRSQVPKDSRETLLMMAPVSNLRPAPIEPTKSEISIEEDLSEIVPSKKKLYLGLGFGALAIVAGVSVVFFPKAKEEKAQPSVNTTKVVPKDDVQPVAFTDAGMPANVVVSPPVVDSGVLAEVVLDAGMAKDEPTKIVRKKVTPIKIEKTVDEKKKEPDNPDRL